MDERVANEEAIIESLAGKFGGSEPPEEEGQAERPVEATKPANAEPAEEQDSSAEEPAAAEGSEEDVSEEEAEIASLTELAEGLGWEPEKLFELKAKVKIDGEEGEATLKDLLASYQIQGHLTRKSMALSDERKAWEETRTKAQQEYQEKASKLEAAHAMATQLLNSEFANVDWQRLQQDDPIEFNSKYIQWQQHHGRLSALAEAIAQNRQEQMSAHQQAFEKLKTEEQERISQAFPSWNDSAVKEREWKEIVDHAREYGFTEQQVNEVFDHRVIRLLRDAKEYAKLQKGKPQMQKKLKVAPKMVKPGNAKKADKGRAEQIASRAMKTGNIDDIAELLMEKFS